jgi:hypothetical protein
MHVIKSRISKVGYVARMGYGYGYVVGACECGNEDSGTIKCGEFLEQQGTC